MKTSFLSSKWWFWRRWSRRLMTIKITRCLKWKAISTSSTRVCRKSWKDWECGWLSQKTEQQERPLFPVGIAKIYSLRGVARALVLTLWYTPQQTIANRFQSLIWRLFKQIKWLVIERLTKANNCLIWVRLKRRNLLPLRTIRHIKHKGGNNCRIFAKIKRTQIRILRCKRLDNLLSLMLYTSKLLMILLNAKLKRRKRRRRSKKDLTNMQKNILNYKL